MAIELNTALLSERLSQQTPAKIQNTSVQQWKQMFDKAMAENSHCNAIAPKARDTGDMPLVKRTIAEQQGSIPLPLYTAPPQQALYTATQKGQPASVEIRARPANAITGADMPTGIGQQYYIPVLNDPVAEQGEESASFLRLAKPQPEKEFSTWNLFVFADQDQAKLWLRDNRGERTQTDQIITRAIQALRARNLSISSVVINGVNELTQ